MRDLLKELVEEMIDIETINRDKVKEGNDYELGWIDGSLDTYKHMLILIEEETK